MKLNSRDFSKGVFGFFAFAVFSWSAQVLADSNVLARCYPSDPKAEGLPSYVITEKTPLFRGAPQYYLWKYEQFSNSASSVGVGVELAAAPRIVNGVLSVDEASDAGEWIRIESRGGQVGGTRIDIQLQDFPELNTQGALTQFVCEF